MPIAAHVQDDFLCVHGGISPELNKLWEINKINRFKEPTYDDFLCDLLWSDPLNDQEAKTTWFTRNKERECSYKFGREPVS